MTVGGIVPGTGSTVLKIQKGSASTTLTTSAIGSNRKIITRIAVNRIVFLIATNTHHCLGDTV